MKKIKPIYQTDKEDFNLKKEDYPLFRMHIKIAL